MNHVARAHPLSIRRRESVPLDCGIALRTPSISLGFASVMDESDQHRAEPTKEEEPDPEACVKQLEAVVGQEEEKIERQRRQQHADEAIPCATKPRGNCARGDEQGSKAGSSHGRSSWETSNASAGSATVIATRDGTDRTSTRSYLGSRTTWSQKFSHARITSMYSSRSVGFLT